MAARKKAPLSPSETQVLRLLWQLGKATVQQVLEALPDDRDIAYATVQTLLRRLEAKGYVRHGTKGKAHVFRPLARREEVVKRTVADFVDRLFGGDAAALMLHLAGEGTLEPADAKRLRELIDKADNQHRRNDGKDGQ